MGLAATQARFLNLTARKTNIEYEAQQINQQRTSLANQSANYYNEMLTLTVPVPPQSDAFTMISYSFSNGTASTYTINQVTGTSSKSTISLTRTYADNDSVITVKKGVNKQGTTYYLGNNTSEDNKLNKYSSSVTDPAVKGGVDDFVKEMEASYPGITANDVYYVQDKNNNIYYYFYKQNLDIIPSDGYVSSVEAGYVSTVDKYEQATLTDVEVTRDVNNRIVSLSGNNIAKITFKNGDNEYLKDDIAVKATTIKDEAAYQDAYNEYVYKQYAYEQQLSEINAQTSVVQAQDKKLELRLKQLDSEESALKTEKEALSSLLKDNITSSFKTFS